MKGARGCRFESMSDPEEFAAESIARVNALKQGRDKAEQKVSEAPPLTCDATLDDLDAWLSYVSDDEEVAVGQVWKLLAAGQATVLIGNQRAAGCATCRAEWTIWQRFNVCPVCNVFVHPSKSEREHYRMHAATDLLRGLSRSMAWLNQSGMPHAPGGLERSHPVRWPSQPLSGARE